jgi:hypothetical protein
MELFLIFANLLQNFEFLPTPNKELPSLQPRAGVTVQPFPYTFVLKSIK